MVDYLYDGTFEGLLTCIWHHYHTEKAAGIFPREEYQSSMLGGFREVTAEAEKAMTVYEAIEKKISLWDLRRIYKAFRSDTAQKETKILQYVRLGFVRGPVIRRLHGDPLVFPVQEAEQKVDREVHRLKGLIRFSELENGILYSAIEPDHDVVEFLAEHFCDRFRNEAFIIHDLRRQRALVACRGQWYIDQLTAEAQEQTAVSGREGQWQALWQEYFSAMAIRERTNPRCQKTLMPVRYWKHLTEFSARRP